MHQRNTRRQGWPNREQTVWAPLEVFQMHQNALVNVHPIISQTGGLVLSLLEIQGGRLVSAILSSHFLGRPREFHDA